MNNLPESVSYLVYCFVTGAEFSSCQWVRTITSHA